jgi:hypothetical protein
MVLDRAGRLGGQPSRQSSDGSLALRRVQGTSGVTLILINTSKSPASQRPDGERYVVDNHSSTQAERTKDVATKPKAPSQTESMGDRAAALLIALAAALAIFGGLFADRVSL